MNEGLSQSQALPAYGAFSQGPPAGANNWASGAGPRYGTPGGYEAHEEKELTEEEKNEQATEATIQETEYERDETLTTTKKLLNIARGTLELADGIQQQVVKQSDSLRNTNQNLDLASNQNELAADKARTIASLNKSIMNPFAKMPVGRSARDREEAVVEKSRRDRQQQEARRAEVRDAASRQQGYPRDFKKTGGWQTEAVDPKFMFEPDPEVERKETEINANLGEVGGIVQSLKERAILIGAEVDHQNAYLGEVDKKTNRVGDQLASNTARIGRLK